MNPEYQARLTKAIIEAIGKTRIDYDRIASTVAQEIAKVQINAPEVNVPEMPEIEMPEVVVNVPEITIPPITVPEPKVTVNVPDVIVPPITVPEVKLPTINVPEPRVTVNVPEQPMPEIRLPDRFTINNSPKDPLYVHPVDAAGNTINPTSSSGGRQHVKATLQTQPGSSLNAKVGIQANDSPSIDAFGRWRVSNPETIFDSKQLFDNQPLFWDDQEVSGSGTSTTHSTARASTTIGVSATTAGKRVRQTYMRFNYQPGKSQLIFLTGVLGNQGTDIAARMGYFDDDNGIFLVNTAGTAGIGIRSSVTGSSVDNLVAQANWNLDTMDGNGPSGIKLDFDKTQIFVIDFEWLGVGRVRTGFVVDGAIYYAHQFLHTNQLDSVYMSTPNLPLRYEIQAGGTNPNTGSLEHICASVISEGGRQQTGFLRHVDSAASITYATAQTEYVVLAVRLKTTHVGLSIDLEDVSCLVTSNDFGHWELRAGGTVAGSTLVWTGLTNSGVEYARGTGVETHSGGTSIDGGYIATSSSDTFGIPNAARLGASIDNTPQEWYLIFRPETNNTAFQASVTWRELL